MPGVLNHPYNAGSSNTAERPYMKISLLLIPIQDDDGDEINSAAKEEFMIKDDNTVGVQAGTGIGNNNVIIEINHVHEDFLWRTTHK